MLSSYLKRALCLLIFFCNVSYALPFTITPKAGTTLPTTVTQNSGVTAYYTVVNNTASPRRGNFIKYLPPNVTQVTTNGTYPNTCGTTFTLPAPGSSCTLQLSITGAVNANDPLPEHHLFVCFPDGLTCSGTNSPLNVSVTTATAPPVVNKTLSSLSITPANIYLSVNGTPTAQITAIGTYTDGSTGTITSGLTWNLSKPAIANVSGSGVVSALNEGTTTISATSTNGIISNTTTASVQSYAYIAANAGIATCSITAGGTLTNCNTTTVANTVGWLALNFNTPMLYEGLTTSGTNFYFSPINSNASLGSQTAIGPLGLSIIASMVVNPQANSLFAGGALFATPEIVGCTLTNGGTAIGTCASTGTGFTSFNIIGSNSTGTMAYIPGTTTISYCTANAGTLTNCNNSTIISTFGATSIVVNPTNTMLYVGSSQSGIAAEITSCSLNTNGTINACHTPQGFTTGGDLPAGLAINAAGTTLYSTDHGTGKITVCTINSDGTLSNCVLTGSVLAGANGIILY